MNFLEKATDKDTLRTYQLEQWGTLNGETCVIELSGLAARSFKVPRKDRYSFREERISVIRKRIGHYKPTLVVMYGASNKEDWERIAGETFPARNFFNLGPTILALMRHPASRGVTNESLRRLGEKLRQFGSECSGT